MKSATQPASPARDCGQNIKPCTKLQEWYLGCASPAAWVEGKVEGVPIVGRMISDLAVAALPPHTDPVVLVRQVVVVVAVSVVKTFHRARDTGVVLKTPIRRGMGGPITFEIEFSFCFILRPDSPACDLVDSDLPVPVEGAPRECTLQSGIGVRQPGRGVHVEMLPTVVATNCRRGI